MSVLIDDFRPRRDTVTLPTIWVAIALSILLHILVLGKWLPQVRLPSLDELVTGEASRSLSVNLAPPSPPPAPRPSAAMKAQPAPAPQAAPPAVAARPRPAPPVIALNKPSPQVPPPPPAIVPPAAAPAPTTEAGDLSSYIEARRRDRVASASAPARPTPFSPSAGSASNAPPVEDDKARSDRAIAANLGLNRAPTFGPDQTKTGGGIFQIARLGYSDAEFMFYGWNKDIRRNTTQMIEVRKGDASDIRIAVVRSMIAIIRDHEQEDFVWESPRLGRNVTLSARQRDNAGLEEFMMREFFPNTR